MNKKPLIFAFCCVLAFICIICCGAAIFLVRSVYNNVPSSLGLECTLEAKACPDGSSVGRNPAKNCQFDECSQSVTACTDDAKICPDGSSVGRISPSCEFEDCPTNQMLCTQDIKVCPDGSYVSRDPDKNCEFKLCN